MIPATRVASGTTTCIILVPVHVTMVSTAITWNHQKMIININSSGWCDNGLRCRCRECDTKFTEAFKWRRHMQRHSAKGVLCTICGRLSKKKHYLISHSWVLHKVSELWGQRVVSLTFCELSKIILRKCTMPEITSMTLHTHTKFQLEILIRSTISAEHKFQENIFGEFVKSQETYFTHDFSITIQI